MTPQSIRYLPPIKTFSQISTHFNLLPPQKNYQCQVDFGPPYLLDPPTNKGGVFGHFGSISRHLRGARFNIFSNHSGIMKNVNITWSQSCPKSALAESGFYVIGLVCPSVRLSDHQSSVTCHYQIFVKFCMKLGVHKIKKWHSGFLTFSRKSHYIFFWFFAWW